jgi:hypothetical protein
VLGAPRVAKRLTLSGISPSSVEIVRGATPGANIRLCPVKCTH